MHRTRGERADVLAVRRETGDQATAALQRLREQIRLGRLLAGHRGTLVEHRRDGDRRNVLEYHQVGRGVDAAEVELVGDPGDERIADDAVGQRPTRVLSLVAQWHHDEAHRERSEQSSGAQRLASDEHLDGAIKRDGHRALRGGQHVETRCSPVAHDAVGDSARGRGRCARRGRRLRERRCGGSGRPHVDRARANQPGVADVQNGVVTEHLSDIAAFVDRSGRRQLADESSESVGRLRPPSVHAGHQRRHARDHDACRGDRRKELAPRERTLTTAQEVGEHHRRRQRDTERRHRREHQRFGESYVDDPSLVRGLQQQRSDGEHQRAGRPRRPRTARQQRHHQHRHVRRDDRPAPHDVADPERRNIEQ